MKKSWPEPVPEEILDGKCVILKMTSEFFVELCHPGARHFDVIDNALPEDAKVVDVWFEDMGGVVNFIISSKEFEPTPLGKEYPLHPGPTFKLIFDPPPEQLEGGNNATRPGSS